MSNNVLKEFLVAVGFKVDTSSYKRMTDDVDRVGKRLNDLDHQDRTRAESEKKRTEERKAGYNGLALALGGVAVAATAAAGVVAAAVGKMVGGFDQFYFISQRTGASVNNLKAIGYAFSQVGSTAESALQAIESFAQKRRTNPGIDGLLRSYGVDTKGDTADVLDRSVQAIQDRHPYYTGSQVAGLLGITEEQFQTFTKYRAEIKRYREEYARLQRDLNVNSDETARASASVSRSIGTITATLGVLAEKFFSTVAPVLERMVDGLRRWIAAHPEEIDRMMQGVARALEAVGMGLTKVGEWFSDEGNLNKFMGFWTNVYGAIERVVKIVTALLDAMFKLSNVFNSGPVKKYLDFMFGGGLLGGSIFGTSAQAAEGGARAEGGGGGRSGASAAGGANDNGAEKPGLFRRGWNAVKRGLGIGGISDDGPRVGSRGAVPSSQSGREQRAMARLIARGWTPEAAASAIGQAVEESGVRSDGPLGDTKRFGTGDAAAHGMFQWRDGRYRALKNFAEARGKDWTDFDTQVDFFDQERKTRSRRERNWHTVTDLGEGNQTGKVFEGYYGGLQAQREAHARRLLNTYRRSGSPNAAPIPAVPADNSRARAMSPGGFDVNAYLRTPPMGATSNSTDMSKTFHNNAPVTVNVQGGGGDAASIGAAAGRGAAMAGDMNLRNVQTALR